MNGNVSWLCVAAAVVASLSACAGPTNPGPTVGSDAGAVADSGPDASSVPFYPAPHANLPRVESLGGPVLTAPKVIPVFFAGDPLQGQIEQFLSQLAGSPYWAATTSEYGVGALQTAPSIVVTDPFPTAIAGPEVDSWLAGYLDGSHPEWPVIDPNNIYLVFYPQGTTITTPEGTSCVTFSGYHSEGSQAPTAGADGGSDTAADAGVAGGPSFVYAVIPRCPIVSTLTGIDAVTAVISHELVEAATDPLLLTNPAYGFVDRDHVPWALGRGPSQGGELGDICHSESAARIHQRLVGDFMVDRMWSNQAAELNQDPCVPAGPDPYIGAAPDFAETVRLYTSATTFYFTTGQKIAVGQTATVDVRLFSTQATADWYVEAVEVLSSPGAPRTLQFAWDKSSGHNGDVLKLMITRTANGALQGTEIVIFSSTTTSFSQTASWDAWSGWVAN